LKVNDCHEASIVELKMLPSHLKYIFLNEGHNKLYIIIQNLSAVEEDKLISVLRKKKKSLARI